MSWYDGGQWPAEPGDRLVLLLATTFHTEPAIVALLQQIRSVELNPIAAPNAILKWTDLLPKLLKVNRLAALIAVVVATKPALKDELATIGSAGAAGVGVADAYDVRLIGPERRPFVDRADLRRTFRTFNEDVWPVLTVQGAERSGKTHSYELFQHVLDSDEDADLRRVDFSSPSAGNDALSLLSLLCKRVGMDDVTDRSNRTTRTRHAVDLVDIFIGRYEPPRSGRRRVIVIDGLNRKDLQPDVEQVVAKLVSEAAQKSLRRTQLILTGFTGGYDPAAGRSVLTERVPRLTRTDVERYLQELGDDVGRPLTKQELRTTVSDVMRGRPGMDELGERVWTAALDVVDGR